MKHLRWKEMCGKTFSLFSWTLASPSSSYSFLCFHSLPLFVYSFFSHFMFNRKMLMPCHRSQFLPTSICVCVWAVYGELEKSYKKEMLPQNCLCERLYIEIARKWALIHPQFDTIGNGFVKCEHEIFSGSCFMLYISLFIFLLKVFISII